jgi:ankyrin repeat protein
LFVSLAHSLAVAAYIANSTGGKLEVKDTKQGVTALMITAAAGDHESMAVLLKAGAKMEATAGHKSQAGRLRSLHWAAKGGHTKCVKLLVKSGARLEARDEGEDEDEDEGTGAGAGGDPGGASGKKKKKKTKTNKDAAISSGKNMNSRAIVSDKDGWTALSWACEEGHTHCTAALIKVLAFPQYLLHIFVLLKFPPPSVYA